VEAPHCAVAAAGHQGIALDRGLGHVHMVGQPQPDTYGRM
jgi:hypothetical protein